MWNNSAYYFVFKIFKFMIVPAKSWSSLLFNSMIDEIIMNFLCKFNHLFFFKPARPNFKSIFIFVHMVYQMGLRTSIPASISDIVRSQWRIIGRTPKDERFLTTNTMQISGFLLTPINFRTTQLFPADQRRRSANSIGTFSTTYQFILEGKGTSFNLCYSDLFGWLDQLPLTRV